MTLSGETTFVSARTGQKNGKNWYAVKFRDDIAEEYFTCFMDEQMFENFQGLAKHTPVILTLNLVPGQKYFTLETVEILNN